MKENGPRTHDSWNVGIGGLETALRRVGDTAGALVTVKVEQSSLGIIRDKGLPREEEHDRLLDAWNMIVKLLPRDTVGCRAGWAWFNFVLEGDTITCRELGQGIIAALRQHTSWRWHVLLTRALKGQPERTLRCDAGYALQRVAGESALVWIEPYAEADWQESQRYPKVEFISVASTSD